MHGNPIAPRAPLPFVEERERATPHLHCGSGAAGGQRARSVGIILAWERALSRELERMGVAELVRRKPSSHTRLAGEAVEFKPHRGA